MSERNHALAAVFAIVLLGSGAQRALQAQAPVDLSGTWVLNTAESDDAQEEFQRWVHGAGRGRRGRAAAHPGPAPATAAPGATTWRAAVAAAAWPRSAGVCSR